MSEVKEMAAPILPAPKYAIGQTLYHPTTSTDHVEATCPDCAGTAAWKVTTGSGIEFEVPCMRCHRHGGPSYKVLRVSPSVREVKVAGIEVVIQLPDKHRSAAKISYRTTYGGGYAEDSVFATEAEALVRATADAEKAQAEFDRRPERAHDRTLSTSTLREALTVEANRLRIEAEVKYEEALDKIRDLKDAYTGLKIRQYMPAEEAQEHSARWLLEELGEPIPDDWSQDY